MSASGGKPHVVLLNPPSDRPHLRGGYCSNVSKFRYYYPAIDLLIQSGWLNDSFSLHVKDSLAERESPGCCLANIVRIRPHAVLFVTGHSSFTEDLAFMRAVKEHCPETQVVASGGCLLFEPEHYLSRYPWLDAVLLDFTSDGLREYLIGREGHDLCVRARGGIRRIPSAHERRVSFPVPRHELFPLGSYNLPFSRHQPVSVVHQTFGCPYRCRFCVLSRVPFRVRDVSDVLDELIALRTLGVREVFFCDPTFGVVKRETMALLGEMCRRVPDISYSCQSRADVLDTALVGALKKSGCHTVQIGIESASDEVRNAAGKEITRSEIEACFAACKHEGLRTLAYIIIGLPGDTEAKVRETVRFVVDIGADYASFNLAVAPAGTELRQRAVAAGLLQREELMESFDGSRSHGDVELGGLTFERQEHLRRKAVQSFYLRPGHILHLVSQVRTLHEVRALMVEGVFLVMRVLGRLRFFGRRAAGERAPGMAGW